MLELHLQTQLTGPLAMPASQVSRLLTRNVTTAVNSVMTQAQQIARAPIPSGPAGVKKSIELDKATIGSGMAKLETSHPLFVFVEEDTRPHTIKPKSKKVLAFKVRGKMVFARKANHPGTTGKHSFAAADRFVETSLGAHIGMAVDAALGGKQMPAIDSAILSALQSLRR